MAIGSADKSDGVHRHWHDYIGGRPHAIASTVEWSDSFLQFRVRASV